MVQHKKTDIAITATLAAISGLIMCTCFPGYSFPLLGIGYLMPVGFIPLFLAFDRHFQTKKNLTTKCSFVKFSLPFLTLSWAFGLIFQTFCFFWTSQPMIYFSTLGKPLAYSLWFLVTCLTSIYFVLFFIPLTLHYYILYKYKKSFFSPLNLAILITGLEIFIPRFFNWSFGICFNDSIYMAQFQSIFGQNTLTFFILFTNLSLFWLYKQNKNGTIKNFLTKRPFVNVISLQILIWLGIFLFGFIRLHKLEPEINASPKARIAYIQPNYVFRDLSAEDVGATDPQTEDFNTTLSMSRNAVESALKYDGKKPDLLIWPESVAPSFILQRNSELETLKNFVKETEVPVLFQATFIKKNDDLNDINRYLYWSTSRLMTANGLQETIYDKWVPMPFGEHVPLEEYFPSFGNTYRKIFDNASKVEVGTSYQSIHVNEHLRVSPSICFDAIKQKLNFLQTTRGQGTLIINHANFVWMVKSNAGLEFSYVSQSRAIENARSIIMATNTGPTVAYDPLGRKLLQETNLLTQKFGFIDLPLYMGQTIYSYFYIWPYMLLFFAACLYCLLKFRTYSQNEKK